MASSPWSHVVRGQSDTFDDPQPVENPQSASDPPPPSESFDLGIIGDAAAAARGKKPVWNVPSNGSTDVGPVMGAVSWPALSESAKASPKSSSDSLKALSEGPVITSTSPKATGNNRNLNPNTTPNPTAPARQKSMKRISGGNSSTVPNGGVASPSPSPPSILTEKSNITLDKQGLPEQAPKSLSNKNNSNKNNPNNNWDHGPKTGYSGNRRGNNAGGPHQNYGNRRDQDHSGHEWNHHRNVHIQQQRAVRPYPRPPPPPISAPFIGPPPSIRPFVGNPVGFPELPSHMYYIAPHPPPEPLRGVPFVAHPVPHAMFFPPLDPQRAALLKQIDYYFSSENLCKDIFLRQNMDDQGWVPISLIAGFNRVKQLTNNIPYILDTVRLSTVVEVQGEKVRRRNDWMNWVLPSSNHLGSASGLQSAATRDHDTLAAQLQTVVLEGASTDANCMRGLIQGDVVLTRSASGNLNNQYQVVGEPSGDGNGQFTSFTESDRSKYARSLTRSDTL